MNLNHIIIILMWQRQISYKPDFISGRNQQPRDFLDINSIIMKLPQHLKPELVISGHQAIELKIKTKSLFEAPMIIKIKQSSNSILIQGSVAVPKSKQYSFTQILTQFINNANLNTSAKIRLDSITKTLFVMVSIQIVENNYFWGENQLKLKYQKIITQQIDNIYKKLIQLFNKLDEIQTIKTKRHLIQLKYFIRVFEKVRTNRPNSTKISILDLNQDLTTSSKNITQIFNFYSDKRKFLKSFKEIKEYSEGQQKKKENDFVKKLQHVLNYFKKSAKPSEQCPIEKWNKSILTGIKIINKKKSDYHHPQEQGNYGTIQKVRCEFIQLITSNLKTHQYLQIMKNKRQINQQKSVKIQLIQKCAKSQEDDFLGAMKIEMYVLKILRDQKCRQIAQYYIQTKPSKVTEKTDECLTLYSKYYPQPFQDYRNIRKNLLIMADLCFGLCFLNENKILHRDLKPDNLRMENTMAFPLVKIIDFGSSCPFSGTQWKLSENYTTLRTTREYSVQYSDVYEQVEKLMTKSQFDRHQLYDIYAFGKIASTMLFGEDCCQYSTLNDIKTFLIGKCLQGNPSDRLSPSQILIILYYIERLTDY